MNVDVVDFQRIAGSDAPRDCRAGDRLEQLLAFERRYRLGVADPGDVAIGIEDDGAGDDGSGQAAPADLVDTCNEVEAHTPERIFQRSESPNLRHLALRFRLSAVTHLAEGWQLESGWLLG